MKIKFIIPNSPKTPVLLKCLRCSKEKPLDSFYNNNSNTSRNNKDYYCIECRRSISLQNKQKNINDKIIKYWQFHYECEEYVRLRSNVGILPGLGDFDIAQNYTTFNLEKSLLWSLFTPIRYNALPKYIAAFNELYLPKQVQPITLQQVKYYSKALKQKHPQCYPCLFIFLRCEKCEQFKRVYQPEFEHLFTTERKKYIWGMLKELNFHRQPFSKNKTCWSSKCLECLGKQPREISNEDWLHHLKNPLNFNDVSLPFVDSEPSSDTLEFAKSEIVIPTKDEDGKLVYPENKDIDIDDCSLPVSETLPPLLENFNFEV